MTGVLKSLAAVFILTLTASAQLGSAKTAVSPATINALVGTNIVNAATTLTNNAVLDTTSGKEVAMVFYSNCTGTNVMDSTYLTFEYGVDGVNWTNPFTWHPFMNGTNITVAETNVTVSGYPYLRLRKLYNSNSTTALTNTYLRYFSK